MLVPAQGSTDFLYQGSPQEPSADSWHGNAVGSASRAGILELAGPKRGTATASHQFEVDPHAEYLFTAEVRSEDRVVFFLGGLSMSYNRQGEWQTVAGLVRSGSDTNLEGRIQLRSLDSSRAAAAEVRNVLLRKVDRPAEATPKPRQGATPLVHAGEARAVIVYPSGTENGRQLAEQVQGAVSDVSGIELPLLSDVEVTEPDHPVLLPEFRDRNLVLIGRLGTNRGIWPAYNRFLAAVDGYYPGGEGYVVRTAANVFGNGRNHIILGGSSETGTERAVNVFLEKLAAHAESGSLVLPWLLEAELEGPCLVEMQAEDAKWENPDNPLLPALTPGYGKVIRWYQNAMGYYWTGWESFRERSLEYLEEILADRSVTHHYIVEFFIRTYNMLDDGDLLKPGQIEQLDSLVVENFLDFLTVSDLGWMTVFSPPYDEIIMVNRHQIAPWYGDLLMARFLENNVELSGGLADLVAFRLEEKKKVFDHFAAHRSGPNLPGAVGASHFEEITATFFRYALEEELYEEFFASSNAVNALALERMDHVGGRLAYPGGTRDLPMWLGAMALWSGDGRYRWLRENIPFPVNERGPFQGRYLAGIRQFSPGSELPPAPPDDFFTGIRTGTHPTDRAKDFIPPTEGVPLVALRSGFEPDDDYLIVAGFGRTLPAGVVAGFTSGGVSWFGSSSPEDGGNLSRPGTNGAAVVRLDHYRPEAASTSRGDEIELLWTFDDGPWMAFETSTPFSRDLTWSRTIIRLRQGIFAVADRFEALVSGTYLMRTGWHMRHQPVQTENGWKVVTRNGTLRVQMLGAETNMVQREKSLFGEALRTLEAGDSFVIWTVLHTREPSLKAELQAPFQLRIAGGSEPETILYSGSLDPSAADPRAGMVIWEPDRAALFGVPDSEADGARLHYLAANDPSLLELPERENLRIVEPGLVDEISVALKEAALDPQPIPGENAEAYRFTAEPADKEWTLSWTYDGLRKPVPVSPRHLGEGIFDLGEVVDLAEIRSLPEPSRIWNRSQLPAEIRAAPPDQDSALELDHESWVEVEGERIKRPGVQTGNYGEAHPREAVDESLMVDGLRTRFLHLPGAARVLCFVEDEKAARHPIRLEALEGSDGENAGILARTYLFPAFPRAIRDDDQVFAVLDAKTGEERLKVDLHGPVQSIVPAPLENDAIGIVALKADGGVETYRLDGSMAEEVSLYELHHNYHQEHGRPDTRHPAGGYVMPFAIGFWRPDDQNQYRRVISRYGWLSFLGPDGSLEGVLKAGAYGSPAMLSRGFDFSGDGREEMLILERFRMLHIGGDPEPFIPEPGGTRFSPEIYELFIQIGPKDSQTSLLSGPPVYVFEVLKKFSGDQPRYAMVARGNYVGIYDALEQNWSFSWGPPAPVIAATILHETSEELILLAATLDGLLWRVRWDARRPNRANIEVRLADFAVNHIASTPGRDGSAIISSDAGLLLLDAEQRLTSLHSEPATTALPIPNSPGSMAVLFVNEAGSVRRLDDPGTSPSE